MFGWLKGGESSHPMQSVEAARSMLDDLDADHPQRALEDITEWTRSVSEAKDIAIDVLRDVLELIEERAKPFEEEMLHRYLADPHLRNTGGRLAWNGAAAYRGAMADAAAALVLRALPQSALGEPARPGAARLAARALKARALHLRTLFLRYEPVTAAGWQSLYAVYRRAEECSCAETPVRAYASDPIHTSPALEFLKSLLLDVAAPESLPPEQVELAYRVVSKFCGSGTVSRDRFAGATHWLSLDDAKEPRSIAEGEPAAGNVRWFGALPALAKMNDMIAHHELGMLDESERKGAQFSPGQRISCLRHFMAWWSPTPPRRDRERVRMTGELSVVHGFASVCHYITHIEAGDSTESGQTIDSRLRKRSGMGLAEEKFEAPEPWQEDDKGRRTLHAHVPSTAGGWAEVGDLCAVRLQGRADWWLAVIRRIGMLGDGAIDAEFEIVSMKPVAVWLRILGGVDTNAANWETTSGEFLFEFHHGILLTDRTPPGGTPPLILPVNVFVTDHIAELLAGEKRRHLQFVDFIEQGEDYDRGTFRWLEAKNAVKGS